MKRFLIVNADDFGRSEAVNLGIAEGFSRGIVTSTSIVATGPSFKTAVALATELRGLGIGVHLTVDEYEPVLRPSQIPRLVTPQGRFYPRRRQLVQMALDRRIQDDLLREWDAQISKVVGAGIDVTHIDGHGHCHAHPASANTVLELATRYRIAHVRMPLESMRWRPGRISLARFVSKLALSLALQRTRRVWDGKLSFPASFYGFSDGGRVTQSLVRRVAERAPSGVSELMVHVGVSSDEAAGFWTGYDWRGDLDAVMAFNKTQFEKQFGLTLVPHTLRKHHGVT